MTTDRKDKKLGDLFAAVKKSAHPTPVIAARAYVVSCVGCGAPRVDGSDARACVFCGGNMISQPACSACGRGMAPGETACRSCKAVVTS